MRICSIKTLKNATSGRFRELMDLSWIYRYRDDDGFDLYHPEIIGYNYLVFCPDELLGEFYRYRGELDEIANGINQKVLARLKNLQVMVEIFPMRFLFAEDEYYRKILNVYLAQMQDLGLKTEFPSTSNSPTLPLTQME